MSNATENHPTPGSPTTPRRNLHALPDVEGMMVGWLTRRHLPRRKKMKG